MPITPGTETQNQSSRYQQTLSQLEAQEDIDKGSLGTINSLIAASAADQAAAAREAIGQAAMEERRISALRESERILEEEVDKLVASNEDEYKGLRKAAVLMAHEEYNKSAELEPLRKQIVDEAKPIARDDLRKLASKQFEALTSGRKKHVNAAGMDTEASGTAATAAGEASKDEITDEKQLTEAQREIFYGKMRDYRRVGWKTAGDITKAGFTDEAGAKAHALKAASKKFAPKK